LPSRPRLHERHRAHPRSACQMVRVGVLFELQQAEACPGDGICVVGQPPELGAWDGRALARLGTLHLRTSMLMYPRWAMLRPIWLEISALEASQGFRLEYKYVMDRRSAGLAWEDQIDNRCVVLPPAEDGSLWLFTDSEWDCTDVASHVTRLTKSEVSARWTNFDPEWLVRPQLRCQMSPSNFLLTPRVKGSPNCTQPKEDEEDEDEDEEELQYSIVREFQALSPTRNWGGSGPLAFSPRKIIFGQCAKVEEEPEVDEESEGTVEDPWETISALTAENKGLRDENETLREMLKKLVMNQAVNSPGDSSPRRSARPSAPALPVPRLKLSPPPSYGLDVLYDLVSHKVERVVQHMGEQEEFHEEPQVDCMREF